MKYLILLLSFLGQFTIGTAQQSEVVYINKSFPAQQLTKIVCQTSGRYIDLSRISGPVNAITAGGSINAAVTSISNNVSLQTSGGSVSLEIPKGAYDLNLRGSKVNGDFSNFNGDSSKQRVIGKINGGGKTIRATTSAGSVNVKWL